MEHLAAYWSTAALMTNGLIILNILGAMGLGILLGYERSFHGHAAGMRTYALVCMASAALVAIGTAPQQWYGGGGGGDNAVPTQVIQGIVTGIGFLGAGVIMKEGFTIRGLSTAASIWTTSAIGIIIGVGFYAAAVVATVLVLILMASFKQLELTLPHRRQLRLSLIYAEDRVPSAEALPAQLLDFGYDILEMSCQANRLTHQVSYELVLQGDGTHNFNVLAEALQHNALLLEFQLSPVRD